MMFDGNSNANANAMQTFNIVTMSESTLDFVKQKQKECKFALTALQDELAFINSSKTIDVPDDLVNSLKELNQI
jgi:fructosamine-3-kinase